MDFPKKEDQTKVKYKLLPVCQILWNFTEGNGRKFTVSFAYDVKYQKTLMVSF